MAYINAFVTHFRAIQEWGRQAQAAIQLDVLSFEIEVKCRGRYMNLHPQFTGIINGRFANTPVLTPETAGFIGWLPYRPLSYELGSDKLKFKQFAADANLPTPATWSLDPSAASPDKDYILKRSSGSFGYELAGPYTAGVQPDLQAIPPGRGTVFAEAFISGRGLKVWYWGQRPFFACVSQPATIEADGASTVRDLVRSRLRSAGVDYDAFKEMHVIKDCLAFQQLAMDEVPALGRSFFLDYRYGREFKASVNSLQSDDCLAALVPRVRDAVDMAGQRFAAALHEMMPVPVVYALDGVLDSEDSVWWVEANSNPVLPPDGYKAMFVDLFGV